MELPLQPMPGNAVELPSTADAPKQCKEKDKNRRKRRGFPKNGKLESSDQSIDTAAVFYGKIQPIKNPNFGCVINLRNRTQACNLDNLTRNDSPTILYYTQHVRLPHTEPLQIEPYDEFNRLHPHAMELASYEYVAEKVADCQTISMPNSHKKIEYERQTGKRGDKIHNKINLQDFRPNVTVDEALKQVRQGTLHVGYIRVNPKKYYEAYISQFDRNHPDFIVPDMRRRHRALNGDLVVFERLGEFIDECECVQVVCVAARIQASTAVGNVMLQTTPNGANVKLMPRDRRFPCMQLLASSLPHDFISNFARYRHKLFEAELTQWLTPTTPKGKLITIFDTGNEEVDEIDALLAEYHFKRNHYPKAMRKYFPCFRSIVTNEVGNRVDLRTECVFTIDPINARDLDDALSIRCMPTGNFIVAVHIADVAHFIPQNSHIDNAAAACGTSVYLPNFVLHMLPTDLCMACSLLPNRDSLALSVIWEITPNAEIVSTSITRCVINSCVQLTYEQALAIITGTNKSEADLHLPTVTRFPLAQIRSAICQLQVLSSALRRRRIANGAFQIEDLKLKFRLEEETPTQFTVEEHTIAHELVEEFMLLANMSVAQKIYKAFPKKAILRRHESPHPRMLAKLQEQLEHFGVHLDTESSYTMARTMERYNGNDYISRARFIALNHLLVKPMMRAEYVCVGKRDLRSLRHYALNSELYTHFTSPIRRYIDITVHRLLVAALKEEELENFNLKQLDHIARYCNVQKNNAQFASEAYSHTLLTRCIGLRQPYISEAVVIRVLDMSFDCLVLSTRSNVRIYLADMDDFQPKVNTYGSNAQYKAVQISYPADDSTPGYTAMINLFQIVVIELMVNAEKNQLQAKFLSVFLPPAHLVQLQNVD